MVPVQSSTLRSTGSQALLQRVFENDTTALQSWNSYKNKNITRSIDIYIRFINAQEECNYYPVSLATRDITVRSSTEMRIACAFVLASNHQWYFQYLHGELYLITGSLENMDSSMIAGIQHWCNMPDDTLTYEFFLRGQRLPEKFMEYILRPYLKRICTSSRTNSATVRTQQTSQSSMARAADSNESSIASSPESSETNEPIPNIPTQKANTLRPVDASDRKIDERINEAFTKHNIHATSTASIEASVTPRRLMAVKNELLRKNVESTSQSSAHAGEPSVASFSAEPQESSRSLPSVVQQEAIPLLQQVNTESFVDDEYRRYLLQKMRQPSCKYWKNRILLHLDSIAQRILRNKRIALLNIMDITVGTIATILLALTTSFFGGALLVVIPVYFLSTICTLAFWLITESIIVHFMKRCHQKKSTCLRNTIIEIEAKISAYPLDADSLPEDSAESIQLSALEKELKQSKQKLLTNLMFLSAHDSITDALIKERRAFDRIAKKATSLKDTAGTSFNAANRYETVMAEFICQKEHVEVAMEPVTESLILALELYSQDKSSIENDINTLLGSVDNELDIFGDLSAEELGQLFCEAAQRERTPGVTSILKRIWHAIYQPLSDEEMIDGTKHISQHNHETLLGLFSEKAHEISPEQYKDIGNESEPNLRNPNTLLADLFCKAKEGLQTSHEISEQANSLRMATVAQVAKTVSRTLFNYSIFYLWRIPYRLHETAVTCTLISAIKVNFTGLLKNAFPNPLAMGGLGIIFWGWFKYMSNKFEKRNNNINQAIGTSRENQMKNYADPYDQNTIPSWMTLKASKTANGTPIIRTREQMGYFNAGVLDDSSVQALSEGEWRALRRQAKHASDELPYLMNTLEEIQLKLSSLTEQLRNENTTTPHKKIVVAKAPSQEIARLLVRYHLLAHHLQGVIKTAQQANYECVRHIHRVNQQVKIRSRSQQ